MASSVMLRFVLREFRGKAALVVAVGIAGCAKTSGDSAARNRIHRRHRHGRRSDHRRRTAAAHQGSLGRFHGRPRAGNAGRGQSRRLHAGAVQGARAQAGQSRRHIHPERRPDRLQGASDGVVHGGRKNVALKYPDDFIANSRHDRAETKVDNSDIVFVGYGVVAPEYGWDDYKGVDVKGKTILMLVNDPPVRVADDTALDTHDVQGPRDDVLRPLDVQVRDRVAQGRGGGDHHSRDRTGRAIRTASCRGSNSQEQFDVISPDAEKRVPVEGGSRSSKAKELLADAGQNFDSLKAAAATQGLQARRAPTPRRRST